MLSRPESSSYSAGRDGYREKERRVLYKDDWGRVKGSVGEGGRGGGWHMRHMYKAQTDFSTVSW